MSVADTTQGLLDYRRSPTDQLRSETLFMFSDRRWHHRLQQITNLDHFCDLKWSETMTDLGHLHQQLLDLRLIRCDLQCHNDLPSLNISIFWDLCLIWGDLWWLCGPQHRDGTDNVVERPTMRLIIRIRCSLTQSCCDGCSHKDCIHL